MYLTTSRAAQAALAILGSILVPTAVTALSLQERATTCNGHAELCDRLYSNVSFVGAHNSYAVGVNNLATNQDYDVTQQLNDGIRMLQMQAHNSNGVIRLCHTTCLLFDGGSLSDYLTKVKSWMDSNPNEIVTLLIVNSDNLPVSQYDSVFQSAGLVNLSYAPPQATLGIAQWPTMGSLIDSGKRLLTFIDNGADSTSVPYIIDEFTNIWETAFDVTDPTFDCNVNRTKGDTSTQMYLINHFLDEVVNIVATSVAPNKDQLNVTNSASGPGSLGKQAQDCAAQNGRSPNFMLVDFYEYGDGSVFQVAATLNGVTYAPSASIATPIPDTAGTNGTTTSSSVPLSGRSRGALAVTVPLLVGAALGAWSVL